MGVIRGKELNDLYATAKVVVGDTLCKGFNYPYYFSDRLFETTGRGGFLIHPYIKGLEDYFEVKVGTNPSTVCTIDSNGDLDITGDYKVNGTNLQTVPTGTVSAFAGSSAPTGYLLCDGSSVNRTTYAALFGVISTTYGSVDSNTFNLPDLRGRVIAGIDSANNVLNDSSSIDGTALGNVGGDDVHTLLEAEMPEHSHSYTAPTYGYGVSGGGSLYSGGSTGSTTGLKGSDQAHNNVQPTIILNYIIKY